jgi:hypothetical protein
LDFASIITSRDLTHAALSQTVSDLNQWLCVIEGGFKDILAVGDIPGEVDPIDEEDVHNSLGGYFDGLVDPIP